MCIYNLDFINCVSILFQSIYKLLEIHFYRDNELIKAE